MVLLAQCRLDRLCLHPLLLVELLDRLLALLLALLGLLLLEHLLLEHLLLERLLQAHRHLL
jgi:hypothetical protein